jgi:AcrR family transcriptional regulator
VSRSDTPRPLRADAQLNREALLQAARTLFVERGTDVPLEDIAQQAGVGRATIYRHFPTRGDLLLGLLAQLVDSVEAIAATVPDTAEGFTELFHAALRVYVENLPLVQLVPPGAELPPGVDVLRDRMHAAYRRPLAAAQAAGAVRADLTPQDIRVLVFMLSAVVRPTTPEADRDRAMRLAAVILNP